MSTETDGGEVPTRERLRLEFRGEAREYFRIWIVNLFLTLLTFGVFSAWAKVRRKRYFYSHTLLDGTSFEYRGRPIPILKGRVLAVLALALWFVATNYVVELLVPVLVLGALAAPWVLVRSLSFNARATAFRNITFDFRGTYLGALKALAIGALVTAATFGLAYPFFHYRLQRFLAEKTEFGGVLGAFHGSAGRFFRIHYASALVGVVGVGMTGLVTGAFLAKSTSIVQFLVAAAPIYFAYLCAYVIWQVRSENYVWKQRELGPVVFESRLRARGLIRLYLTNTVAIVGSLGLAIP
jgi:uncharacterized membrane protein YjgN (DUF898 family)